MSMSSTTKEPRTDVDIYAGREVNVVVFTADGKHLVSGGLGGVRVWRVQDGKETARIELWQVCSLAASTNGRWIAAGTSCDVIVWDAATYERVAACRENSDEDFRAVTAVDFSPDGTQLVTASISWSKTATVWDVMARQQVQTLRHGHRVVAAKYAPQGDRIATATQASVRVWDSDDGRLLLEIPVTVYTFFDTGLLWSDKHLFVLSHCDVKEFDASTGSAVSEWPISGSSLDSYISLPHHGRFIAHATRTTVTFWDTSTHAQLGLVLEHPECIYSMTHSPDGRLLAVGGQGGTITVKHITLPYPDRPTTPPHSPRTRSLENGVSQVVLGDREIDVGSPPPQQPTSTPSEGSAHEATQAVDKYYLNEIRFTFPYDLTMYVTRDGEFPVAAGGYADIYKGTFNVPRAAIKVAIKVIKVYSAEDNSPEKTKRLRREMKIWMKLDHTNVLSLFGTTSGFGPFPAMVCPWLDNGALTAYLVRRNGSLEIQHALALIYDVASGLQYLHSQSIVHGDLSGSNVLIDTNGRGCIADFGLSTVLEELGSTFGTSSTGTPRGTLRWTAPELLDLLDDDTKLLQTGPTVQSDIYSFGSVMLQILSGKVPYHYYSRDVQIVTVLCKGQRPIRPAESTVTDRRWMFIQRCWSSFEDVARRPSSEEIVAFSRDDLFGKDRIHAMR